MTQTSIFSSSPNMALEAVVFPQDPFLSRDLYAMALEDDANGYRPPLPLQKKEHEEEEEEEDQNHYSNMFTFVDKQQQTFSNNGGGARKKRRRTKACKNKEEVENQRMTHIAVERNRRKQMNEYLAVLRSLMPPSYVQRGDQASIIGGAINFVKELEQLLQSMEAQKRRRQCSGGAAYPYLFADFFTFPQYTTCSSAGREPVAENRSAIADIEVTIVESHVNLKVLSRRRPRQLLNMVVGLQSLRLTALHLNVTTVDQMVLYSFSLKVEEDCHLTSVDEIATAVYQMLGRIQEETGFK